MADKVWTADEIAALTSEEDQALFDASLVRDLSEVPEAYLERQRALLLDTLARRRGAA